MILKYRSVAIYPFVFGIGVSFIPILVPVWAGLALYVRSVGLVLVCLGCYYWAMGKGRSPYWAVAGVLGPIGVIIVALLADRHSSDAPDPSDPNEKACPNCGTVYRESDYRDDAPVIYCSTCKQPLPQSGE